MTQAQRRLSKTVQRLVAFSKKEDRVDADNVSLVLDQLKRLPPRQQLPILKEYRKAIRREIHENTLKITLVEPHLSEDTLQGLQQRMEVRTGRKLDMRVDSDPGLIAGIRVSVGYQVYEKSIRAMLNQLTSRHS